VRVSISQQSTALTVTIEDNGCGFDADATARRPGSLGILGMRERAALLGGALTIVSSQGQGTRVKLSLPLEAELPRQHPAEEVHA
jgi:signal transduction histidine kinase